MSFLAQREHALVYDSPPLLPLNGDFLLLALLAHALPRRIGPIVLPLVGPVADDPQRPDARGKVRRDVCVEGAPGQGHEREGGGVQLEELVRVDAVPGEAEAVLEELGGGEREEDVCVRVVFRVRGEGRCGCGGVGDGGGGGAGGVLVPVGVGERLCDVHVVVEVEIARVFAAAELCGGGYRGVRGLCLAQGGRGEGDGRQGAATCLARGHGDSARVVVGVRCCPAELAEEEELEGGDGPGGIDVGDEPLVPADCSGARRRRRQQRRRI